MPQQLMLIRNRKAVALVVVLVILQMVYVWGFPIPAVSLVCCIPGLLHNHSVKELKSLRTDPTTTHR